MRLMTGPMMESFTFKGAKLGTDFYNEGLPLTACGGFAMGEHTPNRHREYATTPDDALSLMDRSRLCKSCAKSRILRDLGIDLRKFI